MQFIWGEDKAEEIGHRLAIFGDEGEPEDGVGDSSGLSFLGFAHAATDGDEDGAFRGW